MSPPFINIKLLSFYYKGTHLGLYWISNICNYNSCSVASKILRVFFTNEKFTLVDERF